MPLHFRHRLRAAQNEPPAFPAAAPAGKARPLSRAERLYAFMVGLAVLVLALCGVTAGLALVVIGALRILPHLMFGR